MIVQLLGALLIVWIIVTVTFGVWAIYRSASRSEEVHAEEAYDRFLAGQEAIVEYVATLPENEDPREFIAGLSADVIRYAETGEATLWIACTLANLEVEDRIIEELERKYEQS